MKQSLQLLEHIAYNMRRSSILMTTKAGSGHVTSALSAADIISVLFFHVMQYDPQHFENPNNDRFILSKGHAAPLLYAAWKEVGVLSEDDLMHYRTFHSVLEGHPTLRFPYAEAATGSLGIGLSIGAGEALAAKQDDRSYRTYVLLGDSEMSEGSVWEAIQLAAYYNLNNLVGIIDCNRLGQSTATMEALEGKEAERFKAMIEGFGWQAIIVNGHDIKALIAAFDQAQAADRPVMIIATTKKGYGISWMEDKPGYHGKPIPADKETQALQELKQRFAAAAEYHGEKWQPRKPAASKPHEIKKVDPTPAEYRMGDMMATRKAYGHALVAVGAQSADIVSLDAEVKNSTYAQLFEEQYPNRFYQCFIAEQNMMSMAVGFDRRRHIPFVSTFGAFLTRAHDQIRMAAIGTAALRIVGSHAGVSIGQDGPSQMALEDIAMMRCLPESIVLYPCDAVSTNYLVYEMANYSNGISYLRTTRMNTPVIYENDETFPIGGCKIVRQSNDDVVCVIGAGVTLFEALKAHEQLAREGIHIAVIDLYSIKPIDAKTIRTVAEHVGGKIITVEDHYPQGGLGAAVMEAVGNDGFDIVRLAVNELPRSGMPYELLAHMGIDAAAIIKQVRKMVE